MSIIIPALNESARICATLEHLQPLRAHGHEVIVVDGASDDTTAALAAPLADRVLVAPRGRANQMNAGAQVARGDVLLFLHADTRLPAGAAQLIEHALAASDAEWGRFDVTIEGRHPLLRVVARAMNLRSRFTGIATGDQAMFVRRATFEGLGGFAPIPLMEDIDLSRRLKRRSPPLCMRAAVVTSGRRWESHGVVRTIVLMGWLRLRYFLGASPERLARRYAHAAKEDIDTLRRAR